MLGTFYLLGIYYFFKLMLFFAIVKNLVGSDALQKHLLVLGVVYTSIIAFLSFVFVGPDSFRAPWLLYANRLSGVSPWLIWLAATLVLSILYFKLLIRFDEGILFWILLLVGIGLVFF